MTPPGRGSVSFEDIEAAAVRIASALPKTPAWSYPLLDALVGVEVVVKHENVQPTGAFKVRGGVSLFTTMPERDRARGVVTASTGNHAQSLAYGARLVGSRAVVVVPESAPEAKVAAVRGLGAEVVVHGPTMTEALAYAAVLAERDGLLLVDPGNVPAIVAGHGTVYLELFGQRPDLATLVVPIGSGTGASGACLVRDRLAPSCRVIGVQSEAAPAAYRSWLARAPVTAPCETVVSGLATGSPFELPQALLRDRLDDFVLVSDAQIAHAAGVLATHAHTLAEGAGAAALAAVLARADLRVGPLAVVCTGGNASAAELAVIGGLTNPG